MPAAIVTHRNDLPGTAISGVVLAKDLGLEKPNNLNARVFMRKVWIDYLRVAAIIAVIIIHSTTPFFAKFQEIGPGAWWLANLLNSAARFAVPLFVMISGALLLGRDITFNEFYRKRAIRLLPPVIAWNLIYLFLSPYKEPDTWSLVYYLKEGLIRGGTAVHLWYLSMFLCLMLFVPFINMLINGEKPGPAHLRILLLLAFLFFLGNIFANTAWELGRVEKEIIWFKAFPWYMAYFIAGYYLDRYGDAFTIKTAHLLILLGVLILFGTALNYSLINSFGFIDDNLIFINTGPIVLPMALIIFQLGKRSSGQLKENKIVSRISAASFGIYLIHPIFLHLIIDNAPMFYSYAWLYIPLTIIFTGLASFFAITGLRQLSFMRKIC